MRAIRVHQLGGPEVMKVEEVDTPPLSEGQVLVEVRAAGVNPVDTYVRQGLHAQREVPYTPGVDGAGVVVEARSPLWRAGDEVYLGGSLTGTYAEQAVCRADQIFAKPPGLSFAEAAGLYVAYYTAHRALFSRGGARAGETVLIHGASGGVGLAAVQLARAAGLTVLGTASTAVGFEAVTREGAHHVLNHRDADMAEQVAARTEGHGPDLILEMMANVNLQKDLDMVAMYGRVVVIGNRGSLDFNPRGTMSKEADVRGMSLFNAPAGELRSIQRALYAGVEAGFVRPRVTREYPLAEAPKAHEDVLLPGTLGKLVLLTSGC